MFDMKEKLERFFGFPRRDEWIEHVFIRVYRKHFLYLVAMALGLTALLAQIYLLVNLLIK
jgi:hypothetical protein